MNECEEMLEARRRYALVGFVSFYTFLVFGAFFGWGPMQLMLEDNGNFASRCTKEEQELSVICPEQSAALVNVQFYALFSQVFSPIFGMLVDRYGTVVMAYCMTACAWSAFALLIFATQYVVDALLYPAYILYGLCTWLGAILNLRAGLLFEGHTRSRVIFVLSSLFDAGAVTFIGLRAIQENTPATVPQVVSGYFALTVVLFGGASYYWTVAKPVAASKADSDSARRTDPHIIPEGLFDDSEVAKEDLTNTAGIQKSVEKTANSKCGAAVQNEDVKPQIDDPAAQGDDLVQGKLSDDFEVKDTGSQCESVEALAYVLVADRTTREQLTSYPYLLLAFFWLVQCTANQWTLTTTRDFLATLGDDEVNNKYLTIFTFMMPVSLAALPFTDLLLSRLGFSAGFQAINFLAIGYSVIRLLSNNLDVQVLGFILFSFFRSFLFGICLSFVPSLLAPEVVGIASGLLFAVAGISSFLNIPLATFAIETQGGDFFVPNLLYTLLIIPCILVAWALGREIKREERAKAQLSKPRVTVKALERDEP